MTMLRWLVVRLAWMTVTLLGITFVTFVVLDQAPVDRAQIEAMRRQQNGSFTDATSRDQAIVQLRIRYGLVDGKTLEPAPVWERYGRWLGNAATLRLAGPGENHDAFWRRLGQALPQTMLIGGLGLLVAILIGVPLGAFLGVRAGSRADRGVSHVLFLLAGVPEFLLATLLLLAFGGTWLRWFPSSGLGSRGAEDWSPWLRVCDHAWHLVLPVAVMASGPVVLITRFLRDSVARAAQSAFAHNLAGLGTAPRVVKWRLVRNGSAPLATLVGSLLPMLVGGSIVVEELFSLDGLGHLALRAVGEQDQAMVMALVLLTSIATLLALLISDVLHRLVDPRVRLQA
jgi:peptide/nickel transport system permease protein